MFFIPIELPYLPAIRLQRRIGRTPDFDIKKKKKKKLLSKTGFDLLRTNVDVVKITALDRSAIPH